MARRATARLFVALDLPTAVRDALVAWRTPVLAGRDGLREVPVASLHVTLAFLGWLPESEIAPLGDVVTAHGEPGCARGLALGEPLWLPRRRPRVLSVGLEDREGALGRLQARVSEALSAGGWYAPERRPFLPHVTLARVRGRAPDAGRLADLPLPAVADAGEFVGEALVLYRSHLGGGGARYEPLARVPLQ